MESCSRGNEVRQVWWHEASTSDVGSSEAWAPRHSRKQITFERWWGAAGRDCQKHRCRLVCCADCAGCVHGRDGINWSPLWSFGTAYGVSHAEEQLSKEMALEMHKGHEAGDAESTSTVAVN